MREIRCKFIFSFQLPSNCIHVCKNTLHKTREYLRSEIRISPGFLLSLQAAEMRVLRLIKGGIRRDRCRNADIREEVAVGSVLEGIERSKLRWYGMPREQMMTDYKKVSDMGN